MDAVTGTLETGSLRWLPLRREMNRRGRADSAKEEESEESVLGYSASKTASREMVMASFTAEEPMLLQCLGICISSSGLHPKL